MNSNLYLIRHGQSTYNLENRFTGWKDVDLTDLGQKQAKEASNLLTNHKFDLAFTSSLVRAQNTLDIILSNLGISLKVIKSEALNERDYGDLVGQNKDEASKKFGKEQVHIWRRSYDISPPNGESLKDVVNRVSPYFKSNISPLIVDEKNILIAAHGNSLRAIMIKVGLHKPEEISSIELPTGSPLCLVYDKGNLKNHFYLS